MLTKEQQETLEREQEARTGNFYQWTIKEETPTIFYRVDSIFHGLYLSAHITEFDADGKNLGDLLEVALRHIEDDPPASEKQIEWAHAQARVGKFYLWTDSSWKEEVAFYRVSQVYEGIEGITAGFEAYDENGDELTFADFALKHLENDPEAPEDLVKKVQVA